MSLLIYLLLPEPMAWSTSFLGLLVACFIAIYDLAMYVHYILYFNGVK